MAVAADRSIVGRSPPPVSPLSGLTTHVLDLVTGKPAAGVRVILTRHEAGEAHEIGEAVTNSDGRLDAPLLSGADMTPGVYELAFHIGDYFAGATTQPSDVRFLDVVPLRFGVSDPSLHYHVPLLVTPWAYSTYRGS